MQVWMRKLALVIFYQVSIILLERWDCQFRFELDLDLGTVGGICLGEKFPGYGLVVRSYRESGYRNFDLMETGRIPYCLYFAGFDGVGFDGWHNSDSMVFGSFELFGFEEELHFPG